jgi:hypothetical protein
MEGTPFLVSTLINDQTFAKALIDTGCMSYGLCDSKFATKNNLQRLQISPREIQGFDGSAGQINEVVCVSMDIEGHYEDRVFFYVVSHLVGHDLILGMPWYAGQDARIDAPRRKMTINSTGVIVKNVARSTKKETRECIQVSAVSFQSWMKRSRKDDSIQVFSASMADINKALAIRPKRDPKALLPKQYHEFLDVFDSTEADKLPPLRGDGVDHKIELETKDGKTPEVPWGPLYNMSREELLVLRKTLTELLDKGFIRVSNSPAAAPVLFVKKPGGGLRFCVDYRNLNRLTKKDRYPLPLIYETLRNIGRARWFTKLDVTAAFHKIRISVGDEWMTAFRTRYGLFEWMVTPFGLANAPSTFQKYINWALREYLDEFCSAYVDDILIYSSGTRQEHREHVRKVLLRMREAGLQLDISKCEFEVQETKYLGFVIEAGKGIRMDPAKVTAILEWEAPRSVKAVQSFLGFANFYRRFIDGFSKIVLPMLETTHKDQAQFVWTKEAGKSFEKLKAMFTSAPMLLQFDHERETILETDSSGWSVGGVFMQVDDTGIMKPCAFFSKKNSPAECNYEIYDKEMLAIIRCLEEWDAELRSVKGFQIRTDHKNLEYFMTARQLTERQMRWSLILSRYNFTISYIPGKDNERADALSRREQDMPQGASDERIQARTMQLLKPEVIQDLQRGVIRAAPVTTRKRSIRKSTPGTVLEGETTEGELVSPSQELQEPEQPQESSLSPSQETGTVQLDALWTQAKAEDQVYAAAREAVQQGDRTFPTKLKLLVSIGECSLSPSGALQFRERLWVPENEPLRTSLIQTTHDSVLAGHPGREQTSALLARKFFWPGMSSDVRRFSRNCDGCHRNVAWRNRRQGFLKPLPIPNRIWQELSIDFVVELPPSDSCTNLIVVTDRLGKGVMLEALDNIETETIAKWFVNTYYRQHGFPRAIVSDRGVQFVSALWKRVCQLLGITRRLSAAFSPETDGATERMNQTVETYLRNFVNHAQNDWASMLPSAELAINNREAASTRVSPFFLTHGYHVDLIELSAELGEETRNERISPVQKADNMVKKLQQATEWAQTAMATAQQEQEKATNARRQQAPQYKVGDKVWLSLENMATDRPTKKLDAKYQKFTILEALGSHNFRLDTPPGVSNVFPTRLLQLAASDPFPSQQQDDSQIGPTLIGDQEEYEIEAILDEKRARGRGNNLRYLVKWVSHNKPTWEPQSALEDTVALEKWKAQKAAGHVPLGGRRRPPGTQRGRKRT